MIELDRGPVDVLIDALVTLLSTFVALLLFWFVLL